MRDARIKPKGEGALSARELLAQWIVRHRMTQGEAADQIGISRIKLNQYLNDLGRPSLETAARIEDTTGIGMRLWLGGQETADTVENSAAGMRVAVGAVNHS